MEKRSNQRRDARFSVVIVDDHPMVRDGLAVMLEARRLARVVAKTSGVDETVRAVHKLGVPDMVLSDIRMPNGDGFELLKKLRKFWPNIRVLLLAGMPLKEEETRAREGGAAGYLPKSCDIDIRQVAPPFRACSSGPNARRRRSAPGRNRSHCPL